MNKMIGVYAIIHRASGRAYVGSSLDIIARWRGHVRHLGQGRHSSSALLDLWLLDGPSAFAFVVLEQCQRETLVAREQEWLNVIGEPLNANRCAGRPPHGPDWSRRVSAAKMGHAVSEDTREKLRLASTAIWATPGVREEMGPKLSAGWTPDVRQRQSEKIRAWVMALTPEQRSARARRQALVSWVTPKAREKRIASLQAAATRPEVKAAVGAASRRWWAAQTPEERSARMTLVRTGKT